MNLFSESIEKYIEDHSNPEDDILYDLYRETNLKTDHPRMLSGALQGQFLKMMAQLCQAENILEIGTFTGYSAICMARGMKQEGMLHTIDIKEEHYDMAHKYILKAGLENRITQHIGNALEVIPSLDQTFDMIFIDADKKNYPHYLDLVIDKLKPGGLIIADNVLWSGKVLEKIQKDDKDTPGVIAFNERIQKDPRLENVLLPLRDGLMLAHKK